MPRHRDGVIPRRWKGRKILNTEFYPHFTDEIWTNGRLDTRIWADASSAIAQTAKPSFVLAWTQPHRGYASSMRVLVIGFAPNAGPNTLPSVEPCAAAWTGSMTKFGRG